MVITVTRGLPAIQHRRRGPTGRGPPLARLPRSAPQPPHLAGHGYDERWPADPPRPRPAPA